MTKVYTLEGGFTAWSEAFPDKLEVGIVAPEKDVEMQYMTPAEVAELLGNEEYVFFDVRKAADSAANTIIGAQAWDMDAAKEGDAEAGKATMTEATKGLDKKLILVCYSGKRYAQATTNALAAIGYDMSKVYTLEGGFNNWNEKLPELTTAGAAVEETEAAPQLSGTMKVVATSDKYVTLFEKFTEDTGVKVELLSMSSGEVLSKLRAEGGTPSADLWFGGGIDAFMAAKADGLLEQVNFDAAAELAPLYKDEENYWFSKGMTVVGFLVNNTLLSELKLEAPATWADLVKPEYEGEVIMSNPAVSGTNYSVVNALLQTLGEEEGWKYFEALNANIPMYGKRGADPLNKVTADEFAIGISYIDDSVFTAIGEMDVSVVYPTDGMPWVPEGVAVFKNAENVDAAKYFVEWLFSNDEYLVELAELDGKDYIKLVKPTMEGIELTFDASIMMKEDLALFGTQRNDILAKFETVMGEKSNTNE
jgi:iron(III) transport system substrate-binding protein